MKIAHQSLRAAASAAVMLTFCSVAQSVQAAALTIAQEPLFLTEGVAPNLLVTLDDSGSMASAYAPDGISGTHATRRYKSAFYNPMYYNPAATYSPPKKVTYNSATGQISVTEYSTSFTSAFLNGFKTNLGSVNLSNNFRPVRTYVSTNNYQTLANNPTIDFGSDDNNGVAAYYYVRDNTLNNCTATNLEDEDCYRRVFVTAAEQQNFANWYSFYRSRALATESAANLAFYTLPDNVRVTWQMLNSCTGIGSGNCPGASGTAYSNRLRNFAGQHRATFFAWLADTPASGGTPLRAAQQRAGEFLRDTTVNGPYAYNPGNQSAPLYACRPSYHILMTDGVWNETTNITVGNVDGTGRALPDTTLYTPRAPYRDGVNRDYGNTLADLAFLYWARDASTIPNELEPFIPYKDPDPDTQYWDPRNNPATWQNLVTFTLGLGLTRTLTNPAWGGSTYAGDYPSLANGTIEWPLPASNQTQNVYELWHAALNSRGEFFSVDSPEDMVEAFKTILNRIADRETSASAVSLESAVASEGNEAYYARFSSENWSGELIKYEIDSNGQLSYQWNARELLNAKPAGSRNILFNRNGTLAAFQWANLSTAQQTTLNRTAAGVVDTLGSQRLDFIRGVRSAEGTTFRQRTHVLGDIVHSSPVVVGPPNRMEGFMNPLVSNSVGSYTAFRVANQNRPKRIYVGGNDGMLHGFDESGEEVFAYVPTAVIPQLNKLTDKGYRASHQYYVDGTPVVGDVYFNGAWRTILVGTLRGGGREVFALDITNPNSISLLWEFSSVQDGDLGFTFTKPVITRLHNGKWGVLLSNGYNSTNDRAALFVLDAQNGSVMSKLVVNSGATVNGLSTPRTVDINGDLVTDYVYAGDLQGNLWRFDMFTANQTPPFQKTDTMANSNFRIAFGGAPLFVARNSSGLRQPITAAPTIIRHPNGYGYIVSVGTGKYIENSDSQADTSQAMSLYGIWDRQTDGKTAGTTPSLNRSNLVEQTMGTATNASFADTDANGNATSLSREIRLLSRNPVAWFDANGDVAKYGWYLDLKEGSTLKGEMVVTDMTARASVLMVATTTPNDDPCSSGIDRWFIALDGFTGGATSFNVMDLSGNNYVNALDSYQGQVVSSVRIPGFGSPAVVGDIAYFNTQNGVERLPWDDGPAARNRQSWRVIGD